MKVEIESRLFDCQSYIRSLIDAWKAIDWENERKDQIMDELITMKNIFISIDHPGMRFITAEIQKMALEILERAKSDNTFQTVYLL